MNTLVPDASVAAKWFLRAGETLTAEAQELLARYTQGLVRLIVPDLFWAEFGNILWKAGRQGRYPRDAQRRAVETMLARNLPTVPSAGLLADAMTIAAAFDRSVYDSIYVALAITSNAEFVTADERLANAVAAYLPVKWLGSLY